MAKSEDMCMCRYRQQINNWNKGSWKVDRTKSWVYFKLPMKKNYPTTTKNLEANWQCLGVIFWQICQQNQPYLVILHRFNQILPQTLLINYFCIPINHSPYPRLSFTHTTLSFPLLMTFIELLTSYFINS